MEPGKSWRTAMQGYEQELFGIIMRYPQAKILELGGGRWPSFRMAEMPPNVTSYTVNDVDPRELEHAGPEYDRACFDVSGDASAFADTYDVVFSRFLAEHVRDGLSMHRNVFEVLKPGGVAFHLIPTLYATPFLINRVIPEWFGDALLRMFRPGREISPKFPAYYSHCYGDLPRMHEMFRKIGYSKVEIRNFYGHFYYEKIPVIAQLHDFAAGMAARKNWSWLASYAYITAYKD